jgi:hypothetical protein
LGNQGQGTGGPDSYLVFEMFEIRPSMIQGLGAFATERIRKGVRLIEYAGERLTPGQADERYPDDDSERHQARSSRMTTRTCSRRGTRPRPSGGFPVTAGRRSVAGLFSRRKNDLERTRD